MDIKSSATYVSHRENEAFKIVITSLSLSREGKVSIQAERFTRAKSYPRVTFIGFWKGGF